MWLARDSSCPAERATVGQRPRERLLGGPPQAGPPAARAVRRPTSHYGLVRMCDSRRLTRAGVHSKIESFIRSKYESKRWAMEGPIPEPETLDVVRHSPQRHNSCERSLMAAVRSSADREAPLRQLRLPPPPPRPPRPPRAPPPRPPRAKAPRHQPSTCSPARPEARPPAHRPPRLGRQHRHRLPLQPQPLPLPRATEGACSTSTSTHPRLRRRPQSRGTPRRTS